MQATLSVFKLKKLLALLLIMLFDELLAKEIDVSWNW